jgi:hypothetical protein
LVKMIVDPTKLEKKQFVEKESEPSVTAVEDI